MSLNIERPNLFERIKLRFTHPKSRQRLIKTYCILSNYIDSYGDDPDANTLMIMDNWLKLLTPKEYAKLQEDIEGLEMLRTIYQSQMNNTGHLSLVTT